MERINIWSSLHNVKQSPWIKIPVEVIPFLAKITSTHTEWVLLLFLLQSVTDSVAKVNALTYDGVQFCNCTCRSYYKAINKFKQLGLRKIGNGIYDLTGLIETIDNLSSSPVKNIIPLDPPGEDEDAD